MPPRRVRRATNTRTGKRVSTKPSVISGLGDKQLQKLIKKAGKRHVLVQFSRTSHKASQMMSNYFTHNSKRPDFKHIIFVDVDVAKAPDAAKQHGAVGDNLPVYCLFLKGALLEKVKGTASNDILRLINQHAAVAKTDLDAAPRSRVRRALAWAGRVAMLGGLGAAVLGGVTLLGRSEEEEVEAVYIEDPNYRVPWNDDPAYGFDDTGLDDAEEAMYRTRLAKGQEFI